MTNILSHKPDIICLQETHLNNKMEDKWKQDNVDYSNYFSHGSTSSKGVLVMLSNRLSWSVIRFYTDVAGRYIIMDIKDIDNNIYTLVNCYMPTRNYENDQVKVLTEIYQNLVEYNLENIIWCGDFNINLDSGKTKYETQKYKKEIVEIMDNLKLTDIWRILHPNIKGYTWIRSKSRNRLDYYLISDHILNNKIKCEIQPTTHSDHALIILEFEPQETVPKGYGFWKFNSSLLYDTNYVKLIKKTINKTVEKFSHLSNKGQLWDMIKHNIKLVSISYSSTRKRNCDKLYKKLKTDFAVITKTIMNVSDVDAENLLEQKEMLKTEIESIEKEKAKGVMLRSKCKYIEEGEKNTAYFLRLEKYNYVNKLITRLQVNNNIIRDPTEILEAERLYYQQLYHDNITETWTNLSDFLDERLIPKLSEIDKKELDRLIIEMEILKSLKSLKNDKSPGTDGLTANFLKFFWLDLKQFMLDSFEYSVLQGSLTDEQNKGIISLLPKKNKNRLFLKDLQDSY